MLNNDENSIVSLWQGIKSGIDSLLHPATCILCDRYHEFEQPWICEICSQELDASCHLVERALKLEYSEYTFPVYSGWFYDDRVQKIMHALKYDKHPTIGPLLGKFLAQKLQESQTGFKKGFFVPVPLHFRRLRERGFNQSERIAQGVAEQFKSVEIRPYLKRIIHTKKQVQLSHEERQQNVRDAFALDRRFEGELQDSQIVLVDDVFTTGATMRECAKVLYKAGVLKIMGLTIATASRKV